MDDKEIWKPVVGFEGFYEVSNKGRVRSLDRIVPSTNKGTPYLHHVPSRIMKPYYLHSGYLQVDLCKDGKGKRFSVHRLVAQAFIPNPDKKPFINHIDETRDNNCVENLEWCTQQENMTCGTVPQRESAMMRRMWAEGRLHAKKKRRVGRFSKQGELLETYPSYLDAARSFNPKSSGTCIISCISGKFDSAFGYKWGYLDG